MYLKARIVLKEHININCLVYLTEKPTLSYKRIKATRFFFSR